MEEIIISFGIIIVISFILYFFTKLFNNKIQNNNEKIISGMNIIPYIFSKSPIKILKEDHVTCFLCLLNKDFISGQMNGMISYYSGKNYQAILLIIEHCEPITSLFQLHDQTILTSSADGTMKKIKMLLNNNNKKKYLVEFVFYTNREFIFKSIQLKNSDDILSCNIGKEFILWRKNKNDDNPLYKVEKILLNNEYIRDILQINDNIFITNGESLLLCWDTNYEMIKKLEYKCKGNNCLYKINDEFTGILLENNGDILLFNNNILNGIKIFNLSLSSLTCLKSLDNNIIAVGIFDNKNLNSFINQYIINKKNNLNENNKNNEIEFIKIKSENIYYNSDNSIYGEKNWQRINTIDKMDNNIILGFGGIENLKNFGSLMIFKK